MNRSLKLYNILLDKNFTKEEAETVISEIEDAVDRKFENVKNTLATKEDLHRAVLGLKGDISSLKDSINKIIIWMIGLILGQTGLIFLILQLVGVFE